MRKRGVKNLIFILLAFFFVGGLVVLASLFRPPGRVMPPETAEMQRLRFSHTENAVFVLEEAVEMLPVPPFVHPRDTVDFQRGPIGQLTDIYLDDDNPEHAAWLRNCAPALERARAALEMEHMLIPVIFDDVEDPWETAVNLRVLFQLPRLMLATAGLEAAGGGDPESVLRWFQDAMSLSLKMHSISMAGGFGAKSACNVVRLFDEQTQNQALEWLTEFDASKPPPPRRALEDHLRLIEAQKYGWKEVFTPFDPDMIRHYAYHLLRSGPARRVFAANLDAILDACCLESSEEFDEWSEEFPKLYQAASDSFVSWYPGSSHNSTKGFQRTINPLRTVLAIEVFRHNHGEYPPALDDLEPEFLPRVPLDNRTGRTFFYQRAEEHYWLAFAHGEVKDPARLYYSDIVIAPPDF